MKSHRKSVFFSLRAFPLFILDLTGKNGRVRVSEKDNERQLEHV